MTTTSKETTIVMNIKSIKAIASKVDALEIAHATSYRDIASLLCAGLESGANSIHHAEYIRRRDAVADNVQPVHRELFLKNVYRATAGLRPSLDVAKLDPIQAARKKEADKKAKQRMTAKVKKENPKADEKTVKELVAKAITEAKVANKDDVAMAKAKAKVIEMLEGIDMTKISLADVRQAQQAMVAMIIVIKSL